MSGRNAFTSMLGLGRQHAISVVVKLLWSVLWFLLSCCLYVWGDPALQAGLKTGETENTRRHRKTEQQMLLYLPEVYRQIFNKLRCERVYVLVVRFMLIDGWGLRACD